jgi:predicted TPR repeat methyltransferase
MRIQLPSSAEVARAIEVWSSADGRLGTLIERYGSAAHALRHYGLVLWGDGQFQSASQALTGAAALHPDNAPVWGDLSSVLRALGQPAEAEACAEESLKLDATQPRIWLQLGSIRTALGKGDASVEACREALTLDEGFVDAWVGLGLAYYADKRYEPAVIAFREAIRRGLTDTSAVQGCLAQALYFVGDFFGAADAFTHALAVQPDNHTLILKRARAQLAVDVIQGSPDDAVAACARLPLTPEEIEKTVHDGFHVLSAYGHKDAAIRLGTYRLARKPDDPMQAYLLASLRGETMDRAPDGYIVDYFDKFADEFDEKLVGLLGYGVPEELTALACAFALSRGLTLSKALDLGCGTGLVGARLTRPGLDLTGVDLSPRMLEKSRQLGCYDRLVESELLAFLARNDARYDLIVAADTLVYFGDLSAIFEGVARALEPGGIFAVSIESATGRDIVHLSSGRFAHDPAYVARAAGQAGLATGEIRATTIRLEANVRTQGALLLFSRRPGDHA